VKTAEIADGLVDVPAGTDLREVEQFLYREARFADENDYDSWEALWTDDAIYWVPASDMDSDPLTCVSIIYDNRNRISTRLKQVRTGKRYAQAPPSHMRRLLSNVEILGGRRSAAGDVDIEVGCNFIVFESRTRSGADAPRIGCDERRPASRWPTRRSCSSITTKPLPHWVS
jgi:benzoate/toluate 1,2-dioxygenase beta subunit